MTLGANDFVLTPNGTWHEHGVGGERHALHLAGRAGHSFRECDGSQFLRGPSRSAAGRRLSCRRHDQDLGQCRAEAGGRRLGQGLLPMFKYEWAPTYEALRQLCRLHRRLAVRRHADELCQPGDKRPGDADASAHRCRCCGPANTPRRTAIPAAASTMLRRAVAIRSSTAGASTGRSAISSVCRPGRGTSMSTARPREDACLFCLSDLPVMRALGLYREQAFGDNGGRQPLTPEGTHA